MKETSSLDPIDRIFTERASFSAVLRSHREAERERAEARDRLELLVDLQGAIAVIAAARTIEEIRCATLRAMRHPLGFNRAVWLTVEANRIVIAIRVADGSDTVETVDEVVEFSAHLEPGRADSITSSIGIAGELSAPIVDVRGWYTLHPLIRRDRISDILYADQHATTRSQLWLADLAKSLALIAAIAIENVELLAQTQHLANRDALTGLYNRRALQERLVEYVRKIEYGAPFVFALIDIDDFKSINDQRGHAVGDAVLRRLARTLTASSRAEDIVARYAGDEFVVILSGVADAFADGMVRRLSSELQVAGLSCSIGAAHCPRDASDIDALFAAADRALYRAKAQGKNRHCMASVGPKAS